MTEASSRHRVALSTQWLHSNVPAQAVPAGFQETLLALLEALGRSDLAALVDLVRVSGPAWRSYSYEEADALDPGERAKLFALRDAHQLVAPATAWTSEMPTVELLALLGDEGEQQLVATLAFQDDARGVLVTAPNAEGIEERALHLLADVFDDDTRRFELLRLLQQLQPGGDEHPRFCFDFANDCGSCDDSNLPFWLSQLLVVWLSHVQRLHVLTRAALPQGIERPLTLKGTKLRSGPNNSSLVVQIDKSTCSCLCSLGTRRPSNSASVASMWISFCGCRAARGGGCSRPACVRAERANLVDDVCVGRLSAFVFCRHGADSGYKLDLTSERLRGDPFVLKLCAVATRLSTASEGAARQLCEDLQDALAESIEMNDEFAPSHLLCANDLLFERCLRSRILFRKRKRDGSVAFVGRASTPAPKHLRDLAETHGTLAPVWTDAERA